MRKGTTKIVVSYIDDSELGTILSLLQDVIAKFKLVDNPKNVYKKAYITVK